MKILVESKDLPSRTLEDSGAWGAKASAGAMAEQQIAAMVIIFLTILFQRFQIYGLISNQCVNCNSLSQRYTNTDVSSIECCRVAGCRVRIVTSDGRSDVFLESKSYIRVIDCYF